ncbi:MULTISPECIES: aldehyde dehydrogenase family protein [unclassified Mesorhizobium]|uniref:aldehyde dehydrogenase family protein n=1 Tax=unclassified Mesorhizobium TaxID=325217 RepID=UPI0003CDFC0C|nr:MULTISPECIES: aldehyde dehydrogenase family protein [unclassified Mesorhizobium]ESY10750.1 aldehyde dehydrogenase [Mesorhizobium sp. LNJC395A00]WJI74784.1 aldehyde dehydrogenase family protein [Mesorhizobium sp. C395A]
MSEIKAYWKNYIDGEWVDGGAGNLTVDDPATGEALAQQALASAQDVDRAVKAAKACHESGALTEMRPVKRGRMVRAMGTYLLDHIDEIAYVLCREAGKPLWEAHIEVEGAARYFEYYGNQCETIEGRSIPLGDSYYDFTVYEPFGVSAHVVPWNYPLEMTARSLSAALTAGNACVVKTPELDPLTNSFIASAAEYAGLPRGAVNILCGLGSEAGGTLVSHPDVNQIVFTGSVPTGVSIASAAAKNVVPCVLELGGKSAAIAWPDANLDNLVSNVRWGIFFNAGQVCSAMSRLIVHEDVHDEVVERVADMARSISAGPGADRPEFGPNMGAMISDSQRNRAESMCQQAERQGGRAVVGGRRLNRPGFFLEPTVFDNITPDMTIAREEVFGPVLSVLKFGSDDEALRLANGTDYGLVSGIFTADVDRAMKTARRLRAGQVFVNEWYAGGVETPFGGYGKSGYGREKGREALWNYLQTKNIAIAIR